MVAQWIENPKYIIQPIDNEKYPQKYTVFENTDAYLQRSKYEYFFIKLTKKLPVFAKTRMNHIINATRHPNNAINCKLRTETWVFVMAIPLTTQTRFSDHPPKKIHY